MLLIKKPVATLTYNAETTPLVVDTWVEVSASVPRAADSVEIFNSTGATLAVSQGAAGSEEDDDKLMPYTILQGGSSERLPMAFQAGKPLRVKAIDNAADQGVLVLNLFG